MTKKLMMSVFLILAMAGAAFSNEIEIGFGVAPPLVKTEAGKSTYEGFFYENTGILHAGYSFAWLFYVSADAYLLPPVAVSGMTGYFDVASGTYQNGIFRPGILGLFNIGIRPKIGPLLLMASTGINTLHIYKQEELADADRASSSLGVNLRVGVGFKMNKLIGIMASGTVAFSDFDTMKSTLEALNDPDLADMASERIMSNLYPAVTISLHL
ncbi:MAG: hypothetical protein ABIJ86_03050 [Spirochaetota bacterium]